ncbi:MAG: glucose-1-phosphate thymidylyltransferase [Dehalococcoidia bacterium]|jgi:glucose-1-phosphate thymidylyltransferase
MKALVLAAGKGTRLKPLTNTVPKHLLPVGNKPILFHVLDYIKEAGIQDIGIVVSPDSGPYIEEAIGANSEWRGKIAFVVQPEPLGLAHAVKVAQGFLGDSPFLMLLGDNLIQDGVRDFLHEFHASSVDASILLKEVSDPRAFGVAELDSSGRVVHMVEKPQEPKSNLAIIGVYLFTPEIHKAIAQIKPSWRGEMEITDAIQKLLEMGKEIRSHVLRGWWLDIGSNDGLIEANRVVLDAFLKRDVKGEVDRQSRIVGRVHIGEGTILESSRVRGPVAIAANCRIRHSVIQPFTNIGSGTVVEDSSLGRSVILENCQISKIKRLADSVIGRNTVLAGQGKSPRNLRLFIGDDCRMELE